MQTASCRVLVVLVISTLLVPGGSAVAKVPAPKQAQELKVTTDSKLGMVDALRYVVLRQDPVRGPDRKDTIVIGWRCTVLDLQTSKTSEFTLSLKALYEPAQQSIFIDGAATWRNRYGTRYSTFWPRLVSYAPAAQRVVLLLRNRAMRKGALTRERQVLVDFDLSKQTVRRHRVLAGFSWTKAQRLEHSFKLGPFDSSGQRWFTVSRRRTTPEGRYAGRVTLSRLRLSDLVVSFSYAFELPASNAASRHGGMYFAVSPRGRRVVLAEYSEAAKEPIEPRPAAYVIDVAAKTHFSLPIHHTPYGLALAGDTLVIGSNQDRRLTSYDLKTRRQRRDLKGPPGIHRLVLSADRKRLYVFRRGAWAQQRRWPSLAGARRLPARQLLRKGQAFAPDRSAIPVDGRLIVLPHSSDIAYPRDSGIYVLKLP